MSMVKTIRINRDDEKYVMLRKDDTIIYPKRGGGEKKIPPEKWWIDKSTPIGEDAELWERMPYGGNRYLDSAKIIGVERVIHG